MKKLITLILFISITTYAQAVNTTTQSKTIKNTCAIPAGSYQLSCLHATCINGILSCQLYPSTKRTTKKVKDIPYLYGDIALEGSSLQVKKCYSYHNYKQPTEK